MPIYVNNFVGAVKKVDPRLLEDNMATEAINCELEAGIVSSIKAPSLVSSLNANTGTVYFNNGTAYQFDGECDVIASPVKDSAGRMYLTDGTLPKKTDTTLHPTTRRLGIQQPTTPITASGDHLSGNTVVATVSYYYTFVTDWGEESAPSPESAVFEVYDTLDVNLSGIEIPNYANQNITKKRIYRLAVGSQGAAYQFLAEVDAAVATYNDTTLTANLGDVCPTETWIAPPDDLVGLIYTANGFMAGFRGNEVYISEPYLPYAWPLANMFSVYDKVVGLGHFGQTTVVCTEGYPVMLTGIDPRSMSQYNYPESYPCLSKRSIVSMLDCVVYASKRGLVICTQSGVSLLTEAIWSEDDWTTLGPSNIIGFAHKGKYYGFIKGTKKGLIIDFRAFMGGAKYPTLIEIDLGASVVGNITSGSIDAKNDALYLITDDSGSKKLYRYGGSSSKLTHTWESKTFFSPLGENLGAGMVNMTGSDTFTYNDGQVASLSLTGPTVFRLPAGHKANERSFKTVGTGDVYSVQLSDTIRSINGV